VTTSRSQSRQVAEPSSMPITLLVDDDPRATAQARRHAG
jgi:hypothetical protein